MTDRATLLRIARFAAGGLVSAPLAIGVTALLHEIFGVGPETAAAFGLLAAMTTNFIVLRYFVFAGTSLRLLRQLGMFLASSGVFRGIEYIGFLILNGIGVQYLIAMVTVLGLSFLLKFLVYDKLVFARRLSSELGKESQ